MIFLGPGSGFWDQDQDFGTRILGPGSDMFGSKHMIFCLKWVHMARYELILKLDGALWLRIISKPLLTPKMAMQGQKIQKEFNKIGIFHYRDQGPWQSKFVRKSPKSPKTPTSPGSAECQWRRVMLPCQECGKPVQTEKCQGSLIHCCTGGLLRHLDNICLFIMEPLGKYSCSFILHSAQFECLHYCKLH